MRASIIVAFFSLAAIAFQTPASAQRNCGSMKCHCRVECGGYGFGGGFGDSDSIRACTRQCVVKRKAAMH
jgi:hypothetical protein